jgi:hypothetical protein
LTRPFNPLATNPCDNAFRTNCLIGI